ncbi:MAG: sulfatase-like hydrolase/transferase, partial [bacterium]|nr:sulfatase-like hydrolase/transferase [bacterium]
GAWSLGCYGNPDIRTLHIDRLASEGMLFTRAYSSNAVCSPTRATFLTGLMPSQHGVHRYLGAGGAQVGPEAFSTIEEFRTLPEILADAGYACGLSGKWHLGRNMEPQEGFTFWVTKPHGHTVEFYDQPVIEAGEIHAEPTYQTEYWTRRGIESIETAGEPFFLFLAYNGPYGLGRSMLNEPRNRHAAYYADKPLDSFPREEMHRWLFSTRNLFGKPTPRRRYAAEISGVDDGVGEILDTLRKRGLDDNTLVIFTADQGL